MNKLNKKEVVEKSFVKWVPSYTRGYKVLHYNENITRYKKKFHMLVRTVFAQVSDNLHKWICRFLQHCENLQDEEKVCRVAAKSLQYERKDVHVGKKSFVQVNVKLHKWI